MCLRSATLAFALLLSPMAWTADKIAEFGLVLEAPGKWSKVPKDDPDFTVYRAQQAREQITIRVMQSRKRMDPKARQETVGALVEHRQEAERRGADGTVSFKPVKSLERGGLTIVTYCGNDGGRPFATMVLASEDRAWTLFYETLESPAESFCPRAEKMFTTVRQATKH